jgi:peptidoglycan/LPS O-acetylase OafA/YrhL
MTNKIYFPGLNGLRFFSALAVIITHVELIKHKLGFFNIWNNKLIHHLGVIGVSFFFVLSGFLITYLMLLEKNKFNSISIRKFYLRRILRIWPLYFLILIVGFFILPKLTYIPYFSENLSSNFKWNLIMYILMLPNLAFSFFLAVPLIGQLWSIGVEEQFYLIWPILLKYFKKISINLLIKILVIWLFIKGLVLFIFKILDENWVIILKNNLAMLKFENMIIGAIGALLLTENKIKLLNFIYKKSVLLFSMFGIFISLFILPDFFNDLLHIVHSFFFIIIILNVSCNSSSFLKLENTFYNLLGKISYGIYMYHLVVIYFTIKFLDYCNLFYAKNIYSNLLLYIMVISITSLVSYMSYTLFERKFLKIKSRYTLINSTS